MDKPEVQILVDLVLDMKKDVSEIKKDGAETKAMTMQNSVVLAEHARRSEASEGRLDVQEVKLEKFITDMEPVKDHVKTVHLVTSFTVKALKVMGIVASLVATVLGILKLLH